MNINKYIEVPTKESLQTVTQTTLCRQRKLLSATQQLKL